MSDHHKQIISSYLGWWQDAGACDALSDSAVPWLLPSTPPMPAEPEAGQLGPVPPSSALTPQISPSTPSRSMPGNLANFDAWLADPGNIPFAHWSSSIVRPIGPPNPQLMILSDFPEDSDCAQGQLFSGEQGALLDSMLVAIGLNRADQRCASIAFTRPPTQRLSGEEGAQQLIDIAHHHIALVRPKILLLLGQQACQIILSEKMMPAPEHQPIINHIHPKTDAFAAHHPRTLIVQPQLKRHAWEVLKRVRELI